MLTTTQIKTLFPREEDLCILFAREMETQGWVVYPETAGFDLLLVWESTGHQLGVEAKLSLNAKVADQIVQDDFTPFSGQAPRGPDFRAVIVPSLTPSSEGIAKMLKIMGVSVWSISNSGAGPSFLPSINRFCGSSQWEVKTNQPPWFDCAWFDFNPAQRCVLPQLKPTVRAGVPSPIQLSPWKIGALCVLADLQLDGFTTAQSVRAHGIDPRRFCSTDGWLVAAGQGRWIQGCVPRFDLQHPEQFAQILAQAQSKRTSNL